MKLQSLKRSLLVVGIAALLTACVDNENFSSSGSGNTSNGECPFGEDVTIPDGFDWSTLKKVDLQADVSDTEGIYHSTIEIFDKNPITSPDAQLLIKGYAKKGNPFVTKLAIPSHLSQVFVRETTPTKQAAIRCVEVYENKIAVNFGGDRIIQKKKITTRSIEEVGHETGIIIPESAPSGAIEVIGNAGAKPAGDYIIGAQTTGITGGNEAAYYVNENSTVTITNPENMKLFILPGKELTIKENLTAGTNLVILVGKNSKLTVNQVDFIGNKARLLNQGEVRASSVTINGNSEIRNYGNMTVNGMTSLGSLNSIWSNYGTWNTMDMKVTAYNSNYVVYHKLIIKNKLTLDQGYIELGDLSYLQTEYLDKTKSIVQMGKQAYFHVTKLARFENNHISNTHAVEIDGKTHLIGEGFYGPYKSDSDPERLSREFWALLRIKKADFLNENNKENVLQLHHDLQLVCDDAFPQQLGAIKTWHVNGTAEWATEDNASIVIPGEEDGGSSPGFEPGGENPSEPDTETPIISNQIYSYIFEDLWPKYGDYDMNDIVIYMENISKTVNTNNKVSKLTFNYTLKAIGATKKIASALMLDDIQAGQIQSVSYQNNTPVTFDVNSSGVEKGQTKAVIPLFDNAHQLLGKQNSVFVNTIRNSPENVENPPVCTVEITFKSPVDLEKVDISKFNLFIITDVTTATQTVKSDKRVEIHLMNYAPTQKANTQLFGQHDDNSTNAVPYISIHNLTWGMLIPDAFKWPAESVNIKKVYPKFVDWVTSGGDENKDWYKEPMNGVF